MDVLADGFKRALGNTANWLRNNPHIGETEWTTLRGQLLGLRADSDEAGKYTAGFIEALEEQSGYSFIRSHDPGRRRRCTDPQISGSNVFGVYRAATSQ